MWIETRFLSIACRRPILISLTLLAGKEREREYRHTDRQWNLLAFFLSWRWDEIRHRKEKRSQRPKWTSSFRRRKSWSSTRNWKSVLKWNSSPLPYYMLHSFAIVPVNKYQSSGVRAVPVPTPLDRRRETKTNQLPFFFCFSSISISPFALSILPDPPCVRVGNYDGSRLADHFLHRWYWGPGGVDGQKANDHSGRRRFQQQDCQNAQNGLPCLREWRGNECWLRILLAIADHRSFLYVLRVSLSLSRRPSLLPSLSARPFKLPTWNSSKPMASKTRVSYAKWITRKCWTLKRYSATNCKCLPRKSCRKRYDTSSCVPETPSAHSFSWCHCSKVIVPKARNEILGVVIVESGWGSMLPTVVIANLAPAGAAARCGQLNIGDQIIAINGISLVGLPLSTCQTYIKVRGFNLSYFYAQQFLFYLKFWSNTIPH